MTSRFRTVRLRARKAHAGGAQRGRLGCPGLSLLERASEVPVRRWGPDPRPPAALYRAGTVIGAAPSAPHRLAPTGGVVLAVLELEGAVEAAELRGEAGSPRRLFQNREDSAIFLDGERPGAGAGGSYGVLDDDRCREGRRLKVGRVRGLEGAQEPGQARRLLGIEEVGLVRDDDRHGAHGAASPTPYLGGQAPNLPLAGERRLCGFVHTME
jgi:hypothetical protein